MRATPTTTTAGAAAPSVTVDTTTDTDRGESIFAAEWVIVRCLGDDAWLAASLLALPRLTLTRAATIRQAVADALAWYHHHDGWAGIRSAALEALARHPRPMIRSLHSVDAWDIRPGPPVSSRVIRYLSATPRAPSSSTQTG